MKYNKQHILKFCTSIQHCSLLLMIFWGVQTHIPSLNKHFWMSIYVSFVFIFPLIPVEAVEGLMFSTINTLQSNSDLLSFLCLFCQ